MANGLLRRSAAAADIRRILIVVGVVLVAGGALNAARYHWVDEATAGRPYDFDLNWVAAHRLLDREPIYDRPASRAEGLRRVGPEMRDTNHGPFSSFIGLPSTALAYVPFTLLEAGSAADVFRLVDLLAMLAAILVTLLALPPPSRLPAGLIAVGAFLLSTPVNRSIFLGQVDGFLMIGLAVAFVGVTKGRWRLVGIGIGVAALLKLSPVILLVYLALRRKWQALWWGVGTIVAVLASAAVVGRPGELFTWFGEVADGVSQGSRITDNQSLPSAIARVFAHSDDIVTEVPLGGWRFVGIVVMAAGVLAVWWFRRARPVEPLDLAVLTLVALLAGPVTWDHYLTWTLLVLVLMFDVGRWAGRSWGECALIALPIALALFCMRRWTIYPSEALVAAESHLRVTSSIKTAALVLLLGAAAWLLFRPPPSASDTPPTIDAVTASGTGLASTSAVP